jgi:ABC-type methionine transport system permease subunit
MLVPFIIILILIVLVMATAKKFNVSATVPLAVALVMYAVFQLFAKGIIRVDDGQIEKALSMGSMAMILDIVVAVVIYIQAFIWMKQKSSRSK